MHIYISNQHNIYLHTEREEEKEREQEFIKIKIPSDGNYF